MQNLFLFLKIFLNILQYLEESWEFRYWDCTFILVMLQYSITEKTDIHVTVFIDDK